MKNSCQTRQDEIIHALAAWLRSDPRPWLYFERFALEALRAGREHIGAGMIAERMRWEITMEADGAGWKMNNNFRAYLARMFEIAHPEHEGVFRSRETLSATMPPKGGEIPAQMFLVAPHDEDQIRRTLSTLLEAIDPPRHSGRDAVSEKLPSAEDVANETIFDVDIAKALQGDYIAAFRHAIEADRLAVAEAVREACAKVADDWEIETGGGVEHDIRALNLAEIVKGNP